MLRSGWLGRSVGCLMVPDPTLNADYALEAETLWPSLWRVLEDVRHYWTFDSRSEEMLCKDCEWFAEGPFLDCALQARQHRDDVKRAVLELALKTLQTDGHVCRPDYQNGVCFDCGEPARYDGPDLCFVLTEDNGSFCGRTLPCPEHADGQA